MTSVRLLSLVTLVSPDGAYGGPVRVAINQARALIHRGHDVTVAGGQRGFGSDVPTQIDSVPVSLFPVRTVVPGIGFAGLAAPALQRWLTQHAHEYDIIHVHAARDFVTLRAAAWLQRHRVPYVLQTHGMIDPSGNRLAAPLDALVTRRVLRSAQHVFYLTDRERNDLSTVARSPIALRELRNGVPTPTSAPLAPQAAGTPREVLYLARLAPRKRPAAFVEMAQRVAADYPGTRFRLVGPDEGEGPSVSHMMDASAPRVDVAWEGGVDPDQTGDRMARASIYVLPAIDEPYPMSVLEAMAMGLPVVITDSCGLAALVRATGTGIVVDDSVASLVAGVRQLLDDPDRARAMGTAGAALMRTDFSMDAIAVELETAYRSSSGERQPVDPEHP